MSASDEDVGQVLTYTITSASQFFKTKGNRLIVARLLDYESAKSHVITVKVSDDGSPSLTVRILYRTFLVNLLILVVNCLIDVS